MPEAKIPVELGYKEYSATLSQSGTGAPTPNVLNSTDNCFLEGVGFDYEDVGFFKAVSDGKFTEGKTVVSPNIVSADGDKTNQLCYTWHSESEIWIKADAEGTPANDITSGAPFNIKVYN